jgi:hypothetical protein
LGKRDSIWAHPRYFSFAAQHQRQLLSPGRFNLKEATGQFAPNAALFYRCPDNFRYQRRARLAKLGVNRRYGGKWATRTANYEGTAGAFHFGEAAQLGEQDHGFLYALFHLYFPQGDRPTARDLTTCVTKDFLHSFDLQPAFKNSENFGKGRCVSLREKLLGFWGELVFLMRLAQTTPHAAFLDEPIAFERCQLCSDSVVSEFKSVGQVVDRPAHAAQQGNDTTLGACQESLGPLGHFHFLGINSLGAKGK